MSILTKPQSRPTPHPSMRRALQLRSVVAIAALVLLNGCHAQPQSRANTSSAAGIASSGGGGLKTVSPAGGGQIVYGTLENQANQTAGMIYMLRQVHGHFGDKPQIGKLVQARDNSSLAAFFTLTDNNFTHSQQGGMVLVDTVNGRMMAAVLTDTIAHFPTSEPGMMRTLMQAWHPAGAPASTVNASNATGGNGQQQVTYLTQKLYPATAGDHSITVDLPPLWKLTAVQGGQATAEGPNGEFVGVALIWQGYPRAVTPNLFQSFVTVGNLMRQSAGKSQGTYQLISQQPLPAMPSTRGNGTMAQFMVDFHDGIGPRKGNASIFMGVGGLALFVNESSIPVSLYATEDPMMTKIINTARQNQRVISSELQMSMDRIRAQAAANEIQTKAINDRREASAQSYEQQRQATNTRNAASGNSNFGDINAGSADMQNYILDRAVVQSTTTGNYATVSDGFADSIVKANPDKLQITTNRALSANGDW